MGGYLFDTMVHVHAYDRIPEKWQRQWKEATVGSKPLILFEPLIAEILYQLTEKKGYNTASSRIYWLKALSNTKIIPLDKDHDEIAFAAASAFKEFKEHGLSLVDSFSLVIAKEERADIFTTEHGLRDAGNDFGVRVSFLPKEIFKR